MAGCGKKYSFCRYIQNKDEIKHNKRTEKSTTVFLISLCAIFRSYPTNLHTPPPSPLCPHNPHRHPHFYFVRRFLGTLIIMYSNSLKRFLPSATTARAHPLISVKNVRFCSILKLAKNKMYRFVKSRNGDDVLIVHFRRQVLRNSRTVVFFF